MSLLITQCVTSSGYDSRAVSVATLSFFNQRVKSNLSEKPWAGDWIFRRERLQLVDAELRQFKPDILVGQEVMSRIGSPSETDVSILEAGSLAGYKFDSVITQRHEDTKEQEALAVAFSLPVKAPESSDASVRRSWLIGSQGYLAATLLEFEGQIVPVFNIHMPPSRDDENLWYRFVQERILGFLRVNRLCLERIIVAGYMPANIGSARYEDFLTSLQLKDAASGECDIESDCVTASPVYQLFMATIEDQGIAARHDRILVGSGTFVYNSRRVFTESGDVSSYSKRYGLKQLWPSQRYGWTASVRLPRCGPYDEAL